jgi:hypothetical protein
VTVIGAPEEWVSLIDGMVPEVLHLVVTTWDEMPTPNPNASEDEITQTLWRALVQNRDARRLPFQIRTQVVELDPGEGADLGRMDIAFIALVPREDIYFCLESKRLNVPTDGKVRAYASEYVRFGMLRFVTGQYANAVRHGAMMAYVIDGDVGRAIRNVEGNIRQHCATLGMTPPGAFVPSGTITSDARALETHHQRARENTHFRIHHLFMSASRAVTQARTKPLRTATV